jgi:hypothetical protein
LRLALVALLGFFPMHQHAIVPLAKRGTASELGRPLAAVNMDSG